MEWHVTAMLSAQGALTLEGAVHDGTPVDLLIAAVAGCFVKSCHMVQEAKGAAKTEIRAEVVGVKAEDAPNRVARVTIRWAIPDLAAEDAARIARDAKRICTVTNSMSCAFEVIAQ